MSGPEDGETVLCCGHVNPANFINVPKSEQFPFNWILLCETCGPDLRKGMKLKEAVWHGDPQPLIQPKTN